MSSDKKFANAFSGKSARPCDNCVKKRARFYCAADDAFLCQICDFSVHSAYPLAKRHERVRLKTSSFITEENSRISVPKWHQGFTRKARTPRQKKPTVQNPIYLVPEMNWSEENSREENEEQLQFRVPIFDEDMNSLDGFFSSEINLAEFAADVGSSLGKGLDDELLNMERLGLLDCGENEREFKECNERVLKVEDELVMVEGGDNLEIDIGRETFELNFDYDSPTIGEDLFDDKTGIGEGCLVNDIEDCRVGGVYKKKSFLTLDYDGVMSAWDDGKSPWTTGERPELDSGELWPDCVGTSCGTMNVYGDHMGVMTSGHGVAMVDEGREARVSRYREKRRTRLFSKKIRYEVRKLNAEKRPRMKGRFVKRANFVTPSPFPLLATK